MTKTRASFATKGHFRNFVERLKKTLRLSASDESEGVAEPLSLDDLPEECISNIISFTSPQDACIFASVSKSFESAAKSDTVWEKFIPPEYASLVPQSQDFSSKKELYFALCNNLFLFEDDKKGLWVEKASGKRCIMVSAMDLSFLHDWTWIPNPLGGFGTVAECPEARSFEIRGRMKTRVLSPRTRYSVYIVFKKADLCYGFADVATEAVVGVMGEELKESCRRYICFDEAKEGHFLRREVGRKNLVKPEKRKDGWMEIEIGEFFNSCDEIEMSVLETKQCRVKRGLIILGIEIRSAKLRL